MCFNDGASSLASVSSFLKLKPTSIALKFLKRKDFGRIKKSIYNSSDVAKKLRKHRKRVRKGIEDKQAQKEGVMYAAGEFDANEPDPGNSDTDNSDHDSCSVTDDTDTESKSDSTSISSDMD